MIALGCDRSFTNAIRATRGTCPLGLWPDAPDGSRVYRHYARPSIDRLNLIYHVYPSRKNDAWRANVRRLAARLGIFNGSRSIAVAVDDATYDASEVERELRGNADLFEMPNHRELREAATLRPLLERVESLADNEATFYGHTKGNSTRDNRLGAELWRNAMYHALLDGANACRDLLLKHPCVGTHKMAWPEGMPPYPNGFSYGRWMYAGTFWWFRNRDIFSKPHWSRVPQDRYGAEAWLSGLVDVDEAATVFQPWPASEYPTPSPYDPALYLYPIRDT